MLHPHLELRFLNEEIGYGLVATRFIPRGTITWTLCALEQVFDPSSYARLPAAYKPYLEKYAYSTSSGDRVLCCDLGRFMNHSCEANTLTLPDAEIEVAIRDIRPGEHVTDDYGTLHLEEELRCLCGSESCRGSIRADDPSHWLPRWREQVDDALTRARHVEQPLESFLGAPLEAHIEALPRAPVHGVSAG